MLGVGDEAGSEAEFVVVCTGTGYEMEYLQNHSCLRISQQILYGLTISLLNNLRTDFIELKAVTCSLFSLVFV